jgi:hypothetical protein
VKTAMTEAVMRLIAEDEKAAAADLDHDHDGGLHRLASALATQPI